ncbi:MAG: hypothetical protein ACREX0_02000 [Noviherbaspirillum sp.]
MPKARRRQAGLLTSVLNSSIGSVLRDRHRYRFAGPHVENQLAVAHREFGMQQEGTE